MSGRLAMRRAGLLCLLLVAACAGGIRSQRGLRVVDGAVVDGSPIPWPAYRAYLEAELWASGSAPNYEKAVAAMREALRWAPRDAHLRSRLRALETAASTKSTAAPLDPA